VHVSLYLTYAIPFAFCTSDAIISSSRSHFTFRDSMAVGALTGRAPGVPTAIIESQHTHVTHTQNIHTAVAFTEGPGGRQQAINKHTRTPAHKRDKRHTCRAEGELGAP